MIFILNEDLNKVNQEINHVISVLGNGIKRVDSEVRIGEDNCIANVSGYWINDLMRIDIKFGVK